jgi:hypothetical protein
MKQKEDGINSGVRNFGRLALSYILYALALGATGWLTFYMTLHVFLKERAQEERAAEYVGAKDRPKEKLKILTEPSGCFVIERVRVDGSLALVYFRNHCRELQCFIKVSYRLISPDGTVIGSDDNYSDLLGGAEYLRQGEKSEAQMKIKLDDRASAISFVVAGQSSCGSLR